MTNTDELKRLAEAALPGRRLIHYSPRSSLDPHGRAVVYVRTDSVSDGRRHICELSMFGQRPRNHPDAAYIAAANPSAILSLIEEVEGLREALGKIADPQPTFAGPHCCKETFEDACELFSEIARAALESKT